MMGAFNPKTRLDAGLAAGEAGYRRGRVGRAGPAWALQRFLIEDEGGVTLFDAGARTMTRAVATPGRSSAGSAGSCSATATPTTAGRRPALGVPVLCHPDEVAGRRGQRRLSLLAGRPAGAAAAPAPDPPGAAPLAWDGGPVKIADTVSEGDDVAGFQVIDLPGHAPGLIGLWRESDRLALVSDCSTRSICGDATARPGYRGDVQLRHRAGAGEPP